MLIKLPIAENNVAFYYYLHAPTMIINLRLGLMSELLKTLNNVRTLRAQARECSLETLEEIHEKLSAIVEDRCKEAEEEREKSEERAHKKLEYLKMLAADGIEPAELLQGTASSKDTNKKQRVPRPPKYKYTDEKTGESKTWTGQGRTPAGIKEGLEQGKSLEDYQIK